MQIGVVLETQGPYKCERGRVNLIGRAYSISYSKGGGFRAECADKKKEMEGRHDAKTNQPSTRDELVGFWGEEKH